MNGLEPSTRYYAVLSSLTQYEKKSAEEWSVTTNDPTFDMFKVENVEATAVTSNSFKANWQVLEGAQSYELTVKKTHYRYNTMRRCMRLYRKGFA